ncbi:hypothetical protein AAC387_Pa05g1859 [Persea americana]
MRRSMMTAEFEVKSKVGGNGENEVFVICVCIQIWNEREEISEALERRNENLQREMKTRQRGLGSIPGRLRVHLYGILL